MYLYMGGDVFILSSRLKQKILKRNMQSKFLTIKNGSYLLKLDFNIFLWWIFLVTYLTYFTVGTNGFVET